MWLAKHSQEYSYTNGKTISALFFGSKTLPIKRGASVDHEVRSRTMQSCYSCCMNCGGVVTRAPIYLYVVVHL